MYLKGQKKKGKKKNEKAQHKKFGLDIYREDRRRKMWMAEKGGWKECIKKINIFIQFIFN